ncbi:hypothetical protein EBZ38_16110 [bacterium]|nr:hypothetical protein [Alphaproteobacteria bacterium]NDC96181.1 hypothetical protein [bacterium]NDD85785.1 hypothetical protein [bacterium]
MGKNIKELLSDENGILSSKRVVAILCVFLLCVIFVLESLGLIQTLQDTALIDALVYISMVCLFGTSVEKFSFTKVKNKE